MLNQNNITNITPPRVPLVDERTGLISREWYRFFLNLFVLTGSGTNTTSLTDLQVGPPALQQDDFTNLNVEVEAGKLQPSQDAILADVTELSKQVDALAVMPLTSWVLSQIAELQAQIDGLLVTSSPVSFLTNGASILYGNNLGGFSNVTIGSGVSFSGGTLSATGLGGTVTAVTGVAPITSTGGTTPAIGVTAAALTKTDDTNVTLLLGGSPSTALLSATSMTLGWTGQLAVSRGGTGLSSLIANGVLYAPSTSTMATNSNFTWNGTTLEIGGSVGASGQLSAYSATSGGIGVFSDGSTSLSAGVAVSSTIGPDISFLKNRGTFASPTGVNNGDTVGRLRWIARDVTGGTGREVARIDSLVESVPAADDIAGSLYFRTRPSGAGETLTIAGQINRLQNWNIGTGAAATNIALRITKTITGSASSYGSYIDAVVQPDATNLGQYYSSVHATAANGGTPYTVSNVIGYSATQGTFNADSTVTNQYGFIASSSLVGATNDYGFYSNIASGTGRWNFFAAGTADNAFNGNSRFGSATAPTAKVHMAAGTATASTAPLKFTSGTNLTAVEAGAVEYDGTIVTSTPNTNYGRAAIPLTNYASGTGTALGTNTEATNAVLLPAANDTITLAAGTYFLDTSFIVTRGATSTTSATARMNIRGAGTAVGNFSGMSLSAPTAGGATANFAFDAVNITTNNVLTAASTTAAGVYTITLQGVLKVTTGGTIIPQYSLSANINAAGTVSKVLYLRLQQMDTQSAAAAGPAGTGWA
jgi:hypothetical protein